MKLQDTHVKAVSGWPRTPPVQENPHPKLRAGGATTEALNRARLPFCWLRFLRSSPRRGNNRVSHPGVQLACARRERETATRRANRQHFFVCCQASLTAASAVADVVEDSIKIVAVGHAEVVAALLGRGGVLQSHQYVVQKRDAHRRLFKHFFTSGVSGELLTPLAVLIGVVTSRCVVVGCKKLRRSSSATWCKS